MLNMSGQTPGAGGRNAHNVWPALTPQVPAQHVTRMCRNVPLVSYWTSSTALAKGRDYIGARSDQGIVIC